MEVFSMMLMAGFAALQTLGEMSRRVSSRSME